MSVRLTRDIRDIICSRLLEKAFSERSKGLSVEKQNLAYMIYQDVYPEALQKKMSELPEGFLPNSNCLKILFEDHSNGSYTNVFFGQKQRIAEKHERQVAKIYPEKHTFSQEHQTLRKLSTELDRERDDARRKIMATLNSTTTLKKLHEIWPEVKEFTKDFVEEGPTKVLAVPTKELNRVLGLK